MINPWMKTSPPISNKEYLCRMTDGYIKMCFRTEGEWLDMWKTTLMGVVLEWTLLPDELVNIEKTYIKSEDYIDVAEKLYYHVNPNSKMGVPNSAYITTEKWYHEWINTNKELSLFDWCLKYKQNG